MTFKTNILSSLFLIEKFLLKVPLKELQGVGPNFEQGYFQFNFIRAPDHHQSGRSAQRHFAGDPR